MEKLTSILATAEQAADAVAVLDKSVQIARWFGARVEFMAIDAATEQVVTARCEELGYPMVHLFSVKSASHPVHESFLRRALTSRPDLIIKSAARQPSPGLQGLQDADWELASECPAPLWLVRGSRWESPIRFAAAVDVSDIDHMAMARGILHTAGFLALGAHGNLDILYTERETQDETLRMERAVRLAQLVREFHVGCERIQMFSGEPEQRLPPLIAARRYDVLVLGGESRQVKPAQRSRGTASRLVEAASGDVVLLRRPTADAAHAGASESVRQQRLHQRQQFA